MERQEYRNTKIATGFVLIGRIASQLEVEALDTLVEIDTFKIWLVTASRLRFNGSVKESAQQVQDEPARPTPKRTSNRKSGKA